MNLFAKKTTKVVLLSTLLVAAVVFVAGRIGSHGQSNRDMSKVWFYNLKTKTLYVTEGDAIPPDQAGGVDGVRAMTVTFAGVDPSANSPRIAYLETHTAELKELLEKIKSARSSGRIFEGVIPSRGSSYYESNTLVRMTDETEWHPISTPEGRKIVTEWQSWKGPHGERPVASMP